jgi:hypothetical protein
MGDFEIVQEDGNHDVNRIVVFHSSQQNKVLV